MTCDITSYTIGTQKYLLNQLSQKRRIRKIIHFMTQLLIYLNIQLNLTKKDIRRNNSIHIFMFFKGQKFICREGNCGAGKDFLVSEN